MTGIAESDKAAAASAEMDALDEDLAKEGYAPVEPEAAEETDDSTEA